MQEIIKAAFSELIGKGMLDGVKGVFDGAIDLEATTPAAKFLLLAHLTYEDVSAKFNYAYPYPINVGGFANFRLMGGPSYPGRFPFLQSTIMDHWKNHREELSDKVLVKFLQTNWQMATSQKNKAREEIKEKGYDADQVIFVPVLEVEEVIGEFVAQFYFRHLGYLTTLNVPYSGVKVPDVSCWRSPLLRKLKESRLVENGATLLELTMLRTFGRVKSNARSSFTENESIVIEVEPSSSRAYGGIQQLLGQTTAFGGRKEGYLEGGNYDKGFLVAPNFTLNYDVGILNMDEKGLHFQDCPQNYSKPEQKAVSMKEMDDLFKMALVCNLTFDETVELLPEVKGKTFHEVMILIDNLETDKIIEKIEEVVV